MKLLKFAGERDNIDQVLLVVPDEYDKDLAQKVAEECIGHDAHLEAWIVMDFAIGSIADGDFDTYRPYTG